MSAEAEAEATIETIFTDGSSYFKALIADIKNAKISIDLEMYKFSFDDLGNKIVQTLIEASKRDVKVRVIVDGAGTSEWGNSLTTHFGENHVQIRVFHPFPWRLRQWRHAKSPAPWILKALYFLLRINSRMHRKICIIDDNIVYSGSFNIIKNHLSIENGGQGWRDTGIRLQHANINDLKAAFEAAWNHTPIKEQLRQIFRKINRNPRFRLNNSWLRRRLLYKNLLRRITNCKDRLWITNAYFVPDNHLLKCISEAAKRGVDVRILLPQKSDIFIMPWASTFFYESLLRAGVRIFEYQPSMLHAKTLILDDWMIVGSSNLNHRSLMHDLELDINIRSLETKKILEQQFLQDLSCCKEIELKSWQKRPWYRRLTGRLLLNVKYWI